MVAPCIFCVVAATGGQNRSSTRAETLVREGPHWRYEYTLQYRHTYHMSPLAMSFSVLVMKHVLSHCHWLMSPYAHRYPSWPMWTLTSQTVQPNLAGTWHGPALHHVSQWTCLSYGWSVEGEESTVCRPALHQPPNHKHMTIVCLGNHTSIYCTCTS